MRNIRKQNKAKREHWEFGSRMCEKVAHNIGPVLHSNSVCCWEALLGNMLQMNCLHKKIWNDGSGWGRGQWDVNDVMNSNKFDNTLGRKM